MSAPQHEPALSVRPDEITAVESRTFEPFELSLGLKVVPADSELIVSSFRSVCDALGTSELAREIVADGFPDLFDSTRGSDGCELEFKSSDSLFVCNFHMSALRADGLTLRLEPSERYLELVATVAGYLKLDIVDSHGWPVLSLAADTASVAEAAGESILGGGGDE